jgi:hypothetical protein
MNPTRKTALHGALRRERTLPAGRFVAFAVLPELFLFNGPDFFSFILRSVF